MVKEEIRRRGMDGNKEREEERGDRRGKQLHPFPKSDISEETYILSLTSLFHFFPSSPHSPLKFDTSSFHVLIKLNSVM